MQSVHVRNVFTLYLPLTTSKEMNGIVHGITSVPSVSFSLFDKDQLSQEEYYHIKLLIIDADNVESELPGGLSWAKRRPLTFIQDSANPQLVAGVTLRFKIPEGIFDFRRHRLRPNCARIVVSNALGGSWTNQAVTNIFEIHKKKRLPESNTHNYEVTIGLQWINPNASPEQYSVHDSLFDDETETTELVTRTSNKSPFELPDFSMLNENYVRLYDGNAEITGNLRALNFYKLSDRRMKTDIKSLTNRDCRKILLCIEGVEYKFKSGNASSNRKFIGYIAQQVQQAIPEAVTTIDGVLHVDYQSILPYISEALRQTCTDVEDIESQMKQFQSLLDNLHARFCEYEAKHYTRKSVSFRRISPYWLSAVGSCLLLATIVLAVVLLSVSIGDQSIQGPTDDSQRTILLDLFNSTQGDYWTDRSGWLSNSTVCEWYGVKCNSEGKITELQMSRNELNGTLPTSLAQLTSLVIIQFAQNQISGTIPQSLGQLVDLQSLHLHFNQLSGTIPSSIGQLKNLQRLNLDTNQLSGTIPQSLGQLENIQLMYLDRNRLSGTIPLSLGQLKNVQNLDLGFNQLYGAVPQSLGQLSNVQWLNLGSNQLTGTIPSSLERLFKLQVLHLGYNQLSGTVPASIGQLSKLNVLALNNNQLVGTIPPSLMQLKNLQRLYLNENQLSGTIPSLQEITYMNWIDLSHNKLSEILIEDAPTFMQPDIFDIHCFMHNNSFNCPIPEWTRTSCRAECR